MYVYIYIYLYVYLYSYICVYICICSCMHTCVHIRADVYASCRLVASSQTDKTNMQLSPCCMFVLSVCVRVCVRVCARVCNGTTRIRDVQIKKVCVCGVHINNHTVLISYDLCKS